MGSLRNFLEVVMPRPHLLAFVWLHAASLVLGAEWQLAYRHGKPLKEDDKSAWAGHVDHANWLDADRFVYATHAGLISCVSTSTRKTLWTYDAAKLLEEKPFASYMISDWAVAQESRRIALLMENGRLVVIDGVKGVELLSIHRDDLAQVLGLNLSFPAESPCFPMVA